MTCDFDVLILNATLSRRFASCSVNFTLIVGMLLVLFSQKSTKGSVSCQINPKDFLQDRGEVDVSV